MLSCCGVLPTGFYGQLGHGDYESITSPKDLCIGYQQCLVSCYCDHGHPDNNTVIRYNLAEPTWLVTDLCFCLQDDPDMEEEITPAVVACGLEYTASITRRGQLLTWGLGSRGELGHELSIAGEVGAKYTRARKPN